TLGAATSPRVVANPNSRAEMLMEKLQWTIILKKPRNGLIIASKSVTSMESTLPINPYTDSETSQANPFTFVDTFDHFSYGGGFPSSGWTLYGTWGWRRVQGIP